MILQKRKIRCVSFALSGEWTVENLKISDVHPTHIYENIRNLYEDLAVE